MLFDGSTAFLDPKARRNLIQLLGKLPHTKLIATHGIAFALEVCDRTILLKDGRVFADGPSSELLYDEKLRDDCGVEAIPGHKNGEPRGTRTRDTRIKSPVLYRLS